MPDGQWAATIDNKNSHVLTDVAIEAAWTAIESAYDGIGEGRLPPWFYERELRTAFGRVVTSGLPMIVAGKTTLGDMRDEFLAQLDELERELFRSVPGRDDREAVRAEAALMCQAGLNAAAETLSAEAPQLSEGRGVHV